MLEDIRYVYVELRMNQSQHNMSSQQYPFSSFVMVLCHDKGHAKLLNIGGRYCGKGVNSLRDFNERDVLQKMIVSEEQSSVWVWRSNCEQMCYSN